MKEREALPADLERRHIAAQVDAVQALDIEHRMTIQQLRDRNHMRHDDHPCSAGITLPSLNLPAPLSRQTSQPRRSEAEPRWLLRPEKVGGLRSGPIRRRGGWCCVDYCRGQVARAAILTRLWARIPCPVQIRAPSVPSRRLRSQPYPRLRVLIRPSLPVRHFTVRRNAGRCSAAWRSLPGLPLRGITTVRTPILCRASSTAFSP